MLSGGLKRAAGARLRCHHPLEAWLRAVEAWASGAVSVGLWPGEGSRGSWRALARAPVGVWPLAGQAPERVLELARKVEEYYETGEHTRAPVL